MKKKTVNNEIAEWKGAYIFIFETIAKMSTRNTTNTLASHQQCVRKPIDQYPHQDYWLVLQSL